MNWKPLVGLFLLLFASTSLAGWTPPVVVGPPISTPYQDYSAFVTQDNKTMYLSSDRPGTMGDRDLWVAEKVGGQWQAPVSLGPAVNSSYDEHDPMVDESGTLLFFTSSRPSPYGGYWPWHLYWSHKVNGVWQPAEDMGVPINSSFGEECPYLQVVSRDTFFYFASLDRSGGQGQWDVWVSHRGDGRWETPVNPGYPINTGYLDAAPFLTKHLADLESTQGNRLRMYFTSMRPGGSGHIDLWRAIRIDGLWQNPENLGPLVNWSYRSDRPCFIDDDKINGGNLDRKQDAILYFSDDDRQGGMGDWDIWMTYQQDEVIASKVSNKIGGSNLYIHPNPFASEASVRYPAPSGQTVSLKVFDLAGRLVKVLAEGTGDGRIHTASWDGRDGSGRLVPNGTYFLELNGNGHAMNHRVLLIR